MVVVVVEFSFRDTQESDHKDVMFRDCLFGLWSCREQPDLALPTATSSPFCNCLKCCWPPNRATHQNQLLGFVHAWIPDPRAINVMWILQHGCLLTRPEQRLFGRIIGILQRHGGVNFGCRVNAYPRRSSEAAEGNRGARTNKVREKRGRHENTLVQRCLNLEY